MGYHKNQSSTFWRLTTLKNKAGMSIIEVLIALGMVGILSAVIATVLQSMQRAQNQTNVINTIEGMRLNISKLIADGNAWRHTVSDPINSGTAADPLNCVQHNIDCTNSGVPTSLARVDDTSITNAMIDAAPQFAILRKLNYSDADPAVHNALISTELADSGFTDKGAPCTGWNAAGNDVCPIRWVLKTALECQGTPTCRNPTVRVIAQLFYRPDPANQLRSVINEGKYRVDLRRGAKGDARSERFHAEYVQPPCAGCTTSSPENGGACAATGTVLPFNEFPANENENIYPAGLATDPAQMTFKPGTYTCSAISSCFACGRVRMSLRIGGVDEHFSLTLLAKRWDQVQTTISNATFTIDADRVVQVVQFCDTNPGGDPALAAINLGIALPNYTMPTKFAELQCTRIF